MRRVRQLLRLHYGAGASARATARELGGEPQYGPLGMEQPRDLLEIVEDRYDTGSLLTI
jgi:hypothetical protein